MQAPVQPRWVAVEHGRRAGSLGLHIGDRRGQAMVQFGADGPIELIAPAALRPATEREIAKLMGAGPA